MVGRPYRKSGSGQETFSEVQKWSETLPAMWNWSEELPGGLEVVGRLARRFGTGRETSLRLELVGRPSQKSESGWETLPEVRSWLGEPP